MRQVFLSSSPSSTSVFPSLQVSELERGTLDGGDVLFTGQLFHCMQRISFTALSLVNMSPIFLLIYLCRARIFRWHLSSHELRRHRKSGKSVFSTSRDCC